MKWLKSNILLVVHAGSGSPLALRVQVRKVVIFSLLISGIFLSSVVGTLLFFREMEINRQLSRQVLEFRITDQLSKLAGKIESFAAPAVPVAAPGPNFVMAPKTEIRKPDAIKIDAVPLPSVAPESPPRVAKAESVKPIAARTDPRARLGDLSTDCEGELCTVKLALIPTSAGIAQGYLLVILELEVPRIGAATTSAQMRKRYLIYPGNITRDELTQDDVNALEGKSFKFSRALQTSVDFTVSSLLRPLAVNVYLYDSAKTLVHHERKPIETTVE